MLHLRAIYSRDHERADMRLKSRLREETTEQLRGEVESTRPMLRWPITINLNNQRKAI